MIRSTVTRAFRTPVPKPARRRRRAGAIVVVVSLVSGLSSCGGSVQGESASQILTNAVAAARDSGSFHFVDKEGSGSRARLLAGDAGTSAAQQTSSGGGEHLAVSLVHGVAYVQASSSTLKTFFGLSTTLATQESGKWLSVTKGQKNYGQIIGSLAPDAEFDAYIPQTGLVIGRDTVLHGIPVIPVSGTAPATDSSTGLPAVATLFVAIRAPHLPVGGVVSGTDVHGRKQREEVVFTKWDEHLHLNAPADTVNIASVIG